jgi:levanase/fructan beta-fructosidase
MPFNQQVTFPCELTLRTTSKGLRLFRQPIRELATLRKPADVWTGRTLTAGASLPLEPAGDAYEIQAELAIPNNAKAVFKLLGSSLVLTHDTIQSGGASATLQSPIQSVQILLDRTSIETFVNKGEASSSRCILPVESGLSLQAEGGSVTIRSLKVFPLQSIWARRPGGRAGD